MMQPSPYAWRERARIAQELIVGCGPFDLQSEAYRQKESAFKAVTKLLETLDEIVDEHQRRELRERTHGP